MAQIASLIKSLNYEKVAVFILLLGVFVDISPIKFNPLKAIFKYIGEAFNSSIKTEINNFKVEVNTKFNQLQSEQMLQQETLDKLISDQGNKEVSRLRWEIVDFKNSIVNGVKHSRGQYRHVLAAIESYINTVSVEESKLDEDYYREVLEDGEAIREHYEKYKDDANVLYF
jgi:hypothetical protein